MSSESKNSSLEEKAPADLPAAKAELDLNDVTYLIDMDGLVFNDVLQSETKRKTEANDTKT